jgi:hypothetical protein
MVQWVAVRGPGLPALLLGAGAQGAAYLDLVGAGACADAA